MNYISNAFFVLIFFLEVSIAQNISYYSTLLNEKKYDVIVSNIDNEIYKYPDKCHLYQIKLDALVYKYEQDTLDKYLFDAHKTLNNVLLKKCQPFSSNKLNDLYTYIYRKAGINMNQERYAEAFQWFTKAVQIAAYSNINDDLLLFYTGLAAFHIQNYSEMEKYFKTLQNKGFKMKEPYEILISFYIENNRYDALKEVVNKLIDFNIPVESDTYKQIIFTALKNNDCQFLQLQANKLIQKDKSIRQDLANFYYQCKDTSKAINLYLSILNENKFDTIALVQLGIIHYNTGINYLKVAKEIINKDEKNIESYRKHKEMYLHHIKTSVTYLEQALSLNVQSKLAIQCLYEDYKNLQRKEEMNKLVSKYPYLE
ncbi:MAG: hypothetical protein N2449_07475 [Bacteroidales bacterium]|nr:hypothetical protein [Bacteroidales bacterium]